MRRPALLAGIAVLAALLAWAAFVRLPRWYGAPRTTSSSAQAAAPENGDPIGERRIRATLFYVAEGGIRLVAVTRDVPHADDPVAQAQHLLVAQFAPVDPPLAQAIPAGTTVRSVFLTDYGDAYVDLGPEISAKHPGGSLDELFTVYTIVNLLTVNLPAIARVQILIDGKEVDTLAGHIDLRRPLMRNLAWVREPEPPSPTPPPSATPAVP
jgi:hypothetical protein